MLHMRAVKPVLRMRAALLKRTGAPGYCTGVQAAQVCRITGPGAPGGGGLWKEKKKGGGDRCGGRMRGYRVLLPTLSVGYHVLLTHLLTYP